MQLEIFSTRILSRRVQRARFEHTCDDCGCLILPNTNYVYTCAKVAGQLTTHKRHDKDCAFYAVVERSITPKQVITVYTHECIHIDAPEKENPHIFTRSVYYDGFALTFQFRTSRNQQKGEFYFDVTVLDEHVSSKLKKRYRQAVINLLVRLDLLFKRKITKDPHEKLHGKCTPEDASEIFALLEAQRHE